MEIVFSKGDDVAKRDFLNLRSIRNAKSFTAQQIDLLRTFLSIYLKFQSEGLFNLFSPLREGSTISWCVQQTVVGGGGGGGLPRTTNEYLSS